MCTLNSAKDQPGQCFDIRLTGLVYRLRESTSTSRDVCIIGLTHLSEDRVNPLSLQIEWISDLGPSANKIHVCIGTGIIVDESSCIQKLYALNANQFFLAWRLSRWS